MIAVLTGIGIGALVLLWIAWCEVRHIRDRRKHCPPPRCPCGCGGTILDVPALPVDGIPLDDYDKRRLASVLIGFMASPDDDSADERENQL